MSTAPQSWRSRLMTLHGALLRGRRAERLTQQQLADLLGVDRRTVQRWEDGSCDPSSQELFRWADAVGIDIFSAHRVDCDTSAASTQVKPVARRPLPFARPLRRSTALSTTEQARAYHMLVVEGRPHAAVAAALTADRPHGAARVTEEDVRALFRAERSLHFRDAFHNSPNLPVVGENAANRRSVHGKRPGAVSPSRSGAGR
ncbi:helix-turn-helix transcriptional regulator [Aureimonas phyllosphaerae]|uniref:helix-turn-helix transcriptional regulator n=1 Tax=Aureimonas phyllosphaerae TaxID=1166078 RepID=UPI003A5BD6A3